MIFKNLSLSKFRNYENLNVDFHPRVNVFLGENGQGKTNILEALYFCSKGNSFRPGNNLNYIQKNEFNFSPVALIKTNIQKNGLDFQIASKLLAQSKLIEVNGKKINSIKLERSFPIILFSPESLSAIKDGPEERRQLLDQLILTHSETNVGLLRDYRKCLKTRNKVLRDYRQKLTSRNTTVELLKSINGSFLPLATHLTWGRISALREILPDIKKAMNHLFSNQNVDISVDYIISSDSAIHLEKEQIFEKLYQRGLELESAELSAGTTLIGPHKHDIQFLFDSEDSRYFCSQGQQRALILSFKMAQIMYHRRVLKEDPVLLLDDVMSELDEERRSSLIEFLKEINSQIFVTTTDLSFPNSFSSEMSVFDVSNGILQKKVLQNEVDIVFGKSNSI